MTSNKLEIIVAEQNVIGHLRSVTSKRGSKSALTNLTYLTKSSEGPVEHLIGIKLTLCFAFPVNRLLHSHFHSTSATTICNLFVSVCYLSIYPHLVWVFACL